MVYTVDYLQKLNEAVDRYELRFNDWMATQNEIGVMESRGIFPTVWKKEEIPDSEIQQKELALAEATGLAAIAVEITGSQIVVSGMGVMDPLASWWMMSDPKAYLSARDIRLAISNIRGRLKAMILEIESEGNSSKPAFTPADFHPLIWQAAAAQWTIHNYRVAVSEAATSLTNYWRDRLKRTDVDGTRFWQESLASTPPKLGSPRIVWPGVETDQTKKSMKNGLPLLATALKDLAAGLSLTARNASAHARRNITEQEGMEQLAAYSFLARLLDECEIQFASED